MSFTNSQVAERWAAQTPLRGGEKRAKSGTGSVFYEDRVVYSYRQSWPLAKVFTPATADKAYGIMNGERHSITTTDHLHHVRSCMKGPQLLPSALRQAGVPFLELEAENIIDWQDGSGGGTIVRHGGRYYEHDWSTDALTPWTPPQQGMFSPDLGSTQDREKFSKLLNEPDVDKIEVGYWHLLGGALLTWKDRLYLSGLDEGTAFVARLRSDVAPRPTTVEAAYAALKPDPVREAEAAGIKVQRQGEWFFIPTPFTTSSVARLLRANSNAQLDRYCPRRALPVPAAASNRHVCYVATLAEDTPPPSLVHEVDRFTCRLVRGKVVHKQPPRLWGGTRGHTHPVEDTFLWGFDPRGTRQHVSLDLGTVWHRAYRAVDDGSWGAAGKVD